MAAGPRGTGARRSPAGLLLALALALVLGGAPPVQAASGSLCGSYNFDEPLVVPRDDTLRLCPGTSLQGAGQVVVNGTLVAHGRTDSPILLDLPLHVNPGGNASLRWTRHAGVPGAAIVVAGGNLTMEDGRLQANRVGVRLAGPGGGHVTLHRVSILGHALAGLEVVGPGDLLLADANLDGNKVALLVTPFARDARVTLEDATLVGATALQLDVAERPLPMVTVRDTTVRGDEPLAAPLLHLRGSVAASRTEHPVLVLEGSTVADAATGLLVEGTGYRVQSQDNRYEGNVVGARVEGPTVTFLRDSFASTRWDVMLLGEPDSVALVDVTLSEAGTCVASACDPDPVPPPAPLIAMDDLLPVALGFLAALVLALATVGRRALLDLTLMTYERFGPDSARDPDVRERLRRIVVNHPGVTPGAVATLLELPRPAVRLHLRRLEEGGRATVLQEGGQARWYATAFERPGEQPADTAPLVPPAPHELPSDVAGMERDVYALLHRDPGRSQASLADDLGLTRQAVHYHIKKLEDRGLVRKERRGRETLCYPAAPRS